DCLCRHEAEHARGCRGTTEADGVMADEAGDVPGWAGGIGSALPDEPDAVAEDPSICGGGRTGRDPAGRAYAGAAEHFRAAQTVSAAAGDDVERGDRQEDINLSEQADRSALAEGDRHSGCGGARRLLAGGRRGEEPDGPRGSARACGVRPDGQAGLTAGSGGDGCGERTGEFRETVSFSDQSEVGGFRDCERSPAPLRGPGWMGPGCGGGQG